MSEQDFYLLNGNQYRGSRYANFAGGGVTPQGNVSSAAVESASNDQAQSANRQMPRVALEEQPDLLGTRFQAPSTVKGPDTLAGTAKNMAIEAAAPCAASTIGKGIGAGMATGMGFSDAANFGASNLISRASMGLMGTPANATNLALANMGGVYGPATQQAVSKASAGLTSGTGGVTGGALGTGFGAFAGSLLTGGSFKDAAVSGVGSGIGYAVGNMILPGIGGFIGSTLGGMLGGVFGGKPKRTTLAARLAPDDKGQLSLKAYDTKGGSTQEAAKYGQNIADILNTFSGAVGLKFKDGFYSATNIGKKDTGTFLGFDNQRLSGKAGDVGSVALGVLKNQNYYDLGGDSQVNDWWNTAIKDARSISDLGASYDNFLSTRAQQPSRSLMAQRHQGASRFNFAT